MSLSQICKGKEDFFAGLEDLLAVEFPEQELTNQYCKLSVSEVAIKKFIEELCLFFHAFFVFLHCLCCKIGQLVTEGQ